MIRPRDFDNSVVGNNIYVVGNTLSEVWEKSIVQLYLNGRDKPTQYDKPGDPKGKVAKVMLEILDPLGEPHIHRCFPGGIVELETYRQEVVDGIHDHWVNPEEGYWEYTYSQRLFNYIVPGIKDPINQIQYCIDTLKDCEFSRRAIACIWKPWEDAGISDPACLQHVAFSVIDGKLDMVAHMRSNDAFLAAFMNMYAFIDLQRIVSEAIGYPVGTYTHFANDYHIYGSYIKDGKIDGFFKSLETRTFEERTYRTDDPLIVEIIEEAKAQITESLQKEKETGRKGL